MASIDSLQAWGVAERVVNLEAATRAARDVHPPTRTTM
jgi:hypothetical protein